MECTIATLVACFSWSSLFLGAGVDYQREQTTSINTYEYKFDFRNVSMPGVTETGGFKTSSSHLLSDDKSFGNAMIGYEITVSDVRLSFSGGIRKRSGEASSKSVGIDVRWFPFR